MAKLTAPGMENRPVPLAPQRLLGFAFASADLLLEIAPDGRIGLAIGASEALSGSPEGELSDRPWRDFVAAADQGMVEAMLEGLSEGERAGPIIVTLASSADGGARAAAMSAFRMPGNAGAVSCAFSRAAPRPTQGLQSKADFEAATRILIEAAQASGQELEMAFLEFAGLTALRARLDPTASSALDQRLAGALRAQSHGGAAAADLGADRFALVRQRGEGLEALLRRLTELVANGPDRSVRAVGRLMVLQGDASTSQLARAIRLSLDGFISEGLAGAGSDLNEVVDRSLKKTLADVGALGAAVNDKRFNLVYQPVVDLKAGSSLHHYEVLVRFGDNASPYPMIRMAEELDLIEALDIAVVEQTVARLAAEPALALAANISGRTIISPAFVEAVRQMLAKRPGVAARLLLEITESAAIDDLALADRHLVALRGEGCRICLDDFGAGAASLAYLQQLTLDIVKIDGRYIRELQHGGRESAFIRHLVHMCSELGVKTIAEMVENTQAEEAVRRAGVDFAQGWLYGAPSDQPEFKAPGAAKPAARRLGAVDSWG